MTVDISNPIATLQTRGSYHFHLNQCEDTTVVRKDTFFCDRRQRKKTNKIAENMNEKLEHVKTDRRKRGEKKEGLGMEKSN